MTLICYHFTDISLLTEAEEIVLSCVYTHQVFLFKILSYVYHAFAVLKCTFI